MKYYIFILQKHSIKITPPNSTHPLSYQHHLQLTSNFQHTNFHFHTNITSNKHPISNTPTSIFTPTSPTNIQFPTHQLPLSYHITNKHPISNTNFHFIIFNILHNSITLYVKYHIPYSIPNHTHVIRSNTRTTHRYREHQQHDTCALPHSTFQTTTHHQPHTITQHLCTSATIITFQITNITISTTTSIHKSTTTFQQYCCFQFQIRVTKTIQLYQRMLAQK